jgi:hypothetical protein
LIVIGCVDEIPAGCDESIEDYEDFRLANVSPVMRARDPEISKHILFRFIAGSRIQRRSNVVDKDISANYSLSKAVSLLHLPIWVFIASPNPMAPRQSGETRMLALGAS